MNSSIHKMLQHLIACLFVSFITISAQATGQEGDIITIEGTEWSLMGKPIDFDSVLYHRLLDILPKDRSYSTANWDGYKAYWSIRNDYLCLDRIEVEFYNAETRERRTANIPEADLQRVFGKYSKPQGIVASWFNRDIRATRGKMLYYVHDDYFRNLEYEQILTIKQGKITRRQSYHNKVVIEEGFDFNMVKGQEDIHRLFPLHTQYYPELAGSRRIVITISKVKLDAKGNLVDCSVSVSGKDGKIEGLAQEVKTLLKQTHPWKTLYINGEYVSTRYHESITFPYNLKEKSVNSAK